MKKTPFYKFMQDNGAKFVDFAGWEMPISFGSIIEEHNQVRNSGGLFDVSHMGRIKFSGRHARRFLERILTRRVSNMQEGQCRYAMVCNEDGGVLDDVIIYKFEDHWMLVVNASNREKLLKHFEDVKGDFVVKIDDQTESTAMVAVQGPKVMDMIGQFSKEVPSLKKYGFCQKNLLILKMTISRTGYTGEDGVEVILGANMASMAVKLLLKDKSADADVKPCGLGARDTLRMEAGMPLYGHELDEDTNPFEAGLDFAVSLDKDEDEMGEKFIGQDALKKVKEAGLQKTLIGLKVDGKRTPRQGMVVKNGVGDLGIVTSGCSSPTLGCPIAMAYVKPGSVNVGDKVTVDLGSAEIEAEVVSLPFYKTVKK
ncbi:glycine cleavage system aminomethyltransferase GcvT [Poriferisphaera corsica]|uniref:glycine cleavage system aminomethyltransferase GcvT n=1 Tax=Poriferisphaera corsica TaxID=2528020 RepID=UPI0011A33D64|nr:glycine cleavage system aminomethyltransferase GcvT [Poriferisphaera corsica]